MTNQDRVLLALARYTGWSTDEGGWHVNEAALAGLWVSKIQNALQSLREKGLVESARWHLGQGGALAEWLWYPTEAGLARARELDPDESVDWAAT